jgi:hypothetical protein
MKLFVSIHSPVFMNTNSENGISETDVPISGKSMRKHHRRWAPQKAILYFSAQYRHIVMDSV